MLKSHLHKSAIVKAAPLAPWSRPWQQVVKELQVTPERGLDTAEIGKRQKLYGINRLREIRPQSSWTILLNQFRNLIVGFLIIASLLSFIFGEHVEGIAIAIVIFINAAIGFFTELKGARSVEALRKLGSVHSRVRRDGRLVEIPADNLVPGDIVILEGGDIITADLRLVTSSKLEADESILTGESLPVSKNPNPVGGDALLAERTCMLFKGTSLTRGSGEAVVVGTGMETELGKISSLVDETEDKATPLEKRLHQLGHWLIWVSLAIAVFVAVSGIAAGKEIFLMIETAIALAVASIPEGLPIVATIALARGMWRMARKNALVKELSAVETLGATSVICTDKTGTLTENRLTLTDLILAEGTVKVARDASGVFRRNSDVIDPQEDVTLKAALVIGVLCNNASYSRDEQDGEELAVGDPLEVALLAAAVKGGIIPSTLQQEMVEVREEAFDSTVQMMATFNRSKDRYYVAVKGAPETVLETCSSVLRKSGSTELTEQDRKKWLQHNNRLAEQGLRVLALAQKYEQTQDAQPYKDLQLVGLVGFLDPPRLDVKDALGLCKKAGIKVVMMTGDQAVTARTIGLEVGLVDDTTARVVGGRKLNKVGRLSSSEKKELLNTYLFARVSPEQKLDLIDTYQQFGNIVAMTGDGVNDAPALKKADIGISMGKRGTQVAREASDMILKDDAFATIVHAIEQGRIIFNNIRKFVIYLLSCNLSEVMAVSLAAVLNMPLPILPLQILFLNIVTDVFPALALAAGESNPGIMNRPPRKRSEQIMAGRHWILVLVYGIVITAAVLGSLLVAGTWMQMEADQAVTVSFLTLGFAQLFHVFNMRDQGVSLLNNVITRNPLIWGALVLCSLLLIATVYLPGLSGILKVTEPGVNGWILIVVMSFFPVLAGIVMNAVVPAGVFSDKAQKQ